MVTRLDALWCVFRFARSEPTPSATPTAADDTDKVTTFTDWRVVRVTGSLVHSDVFAKALWFLSDKIQGRVVATIPVVAPSCGGVTVNSSETLMAVTCRQSPSNRGLHVYSLPSGKLLSSVVDTNTFGDPTRTVFTPRNTIIVVNWGRGSCLHEYTATCELIRSIPVTNPWSACVSHSGTLIGVGQNSRKAVLLDYTSGGVVKEITIGQSWIPGIHFTRDDRYLLLGQHDQSNITLYSIADDTLCRTICAGIGVGWKDITLGPDDSIIVTCYNSGYVTVFDNTGSEVQCKIVLPLNDGTLAVAEGGKPDITKARASALCCVSSLLYVLDWISGRVLVYE